MINRIAFIFCLSLLLLNVKAQVGGTHIYEFLDLPNSARITALGDYLISVKDDDSNLAYLNPASLSDTSNTSINFSQNFHFRDILNGYISYSDQIKKLKINVHAGIQYMSYGEFQLADEFGNINGTFSGRELAFTVGASKQLNENYSIGSNMKLIYSGLESYPSFGMAIDIGGMYAVPERRLSMGLVFRNIGSQFNAYQDFRENIPFDMAFGISKQLEHLPFRFSFTAHHLHRWNITYDDPNLENNRLFTNEFAIVVDNLFRHVVFNGEFLLGKNAPLRLRFGYNHFRRRELSLSDFRSFAGFSGGFGIKAKKWKVDYGFSIYHLAGSVHHLSFGTSINSFKKKQEI